VPAVFHQYQQCLKRFWGEGDGSAIPSQDAFRVIQLERSELVELVRLLWHRRFQNNFKRISLGFRDSAQPVGLVFTRGDESRTRKAVPIPLILT
jgi:hypothetical protein